MSAVGGERISLAVVGSTSFHNPLSMGYAEGVIHLAIKELRPDEIVSGGAVGVDTLARQISRQMSIPFIEFRPEKNRWEPHGFKARNLLIVTRCTHLLRISCHKSATYGSGWTADTAERQGKIVQRITL